MDNSRLLQVLKPYLAKEGRLEEGILAAVLVIIHYCEEKPCLILTKRSKRLRNHGGEISCPGGTYSNSDRDLLHTAIRETWEEIGIRIDQSDVIGCLSNVHTLSSNFAIAPYVAIINKIADPKPNLNEIDEVIDVPLFDLLKTVEIDLEHANFGEVHRFEYKDMVVWGATARILKQIYDILNKSGMI